MNVANSGHVAQRYQADVGRGQQGRHLVVRNTGRRVTFRRPRLVTFRCSRGLSAPSPTNAKRTGWAASRAAASAIPGRAWEIPCVPR